MLDRAQLMTLCKEYTAHYFSRFYQECVDAHQLWHVLCTDIPLQLRCQQHALLPRWQQLKLHAVTSFTQDYTVYAIDGSQIYPDRHAGLSCYVINIGCVALSYGVKSGAFFATKLYLLQEESFSQMSQELINARRTRYELQEAVPWSLLYQNIHNLVMCDGSLIFWHLSAHEKTIQEQLLADYLETLEQLYQRKTPIIGYISLPQSKELVTVIRSLHGSSDAFKCIVDSDVIAQWLNPGFRSNLFEHNSALMEKYPPHLRIYFFYVHVGEEIARIELPAWLVPQVDMIASIIMDQAEKGRGYPVCLAEAHQQAVVTGVDREFFYQLLQQQSEACSGNFTVSQKLYKKRRLDV